MQEGKLDLGCYAGAKGICEVCMDASTGISECSLARSDRGQKPEETMMLSQEPRDRIRLTKSQDAKEARTERGSSGEPFPV